MKFIYTLLTSFLLIVCLLSAVDLSFFRLSDGFAWHSLFDAHNDFFVVLTICFFVSVFLSAGFCFFRKTMSVRFRGVCIFVMLISIGMMSVSPLYYLSGAVIIFGPMHQEEYLHAKAASLDSTTLLRALEWRGVEPPSDFLVFSARYDSPNVVKKLILTGWNVNGQEYKEEMTALHFSVQEGQYRVAELLVQAGANIDAKDVMGKSPVDYARELDDKKMIGILKGELKAPGQ